MFERGIPLSSTANVNTFFSSYQLDSHRFGKEFTTAVEQKQIAQQDAERAKFVVEKAEQERQAAVIRAEGEAEAANTISAAINRAGDAFVQFRKIEASREIGEFTFFLVFRSFSCVARQNFEERSV